MTPRHTRFAGGLLLLAGLTGCTPLQPRLTPTGQPEAAVAPLRSTGKELTPKEAAEVAWSAGEELKKRGLEADALGHYEKVRQLDPQHAGLAWRLALIYDRQGNTPKAAAEYERALAAEPHNADLLNDVGYFYLQRGDLGQAVKYLEKAVAGNKENNRAVVNLGMALARQGRIDEGLACFARVLPPAQARCNVGVVLAKDGRREDARRQLQEALRLDPGLPQARTFLALLDRPAEEPKALAPPPPSTNIHISLPADPSSPREVDGDDASGR